MAFEYGKLRGRIIEIYQNQGNFAKELKISERSLSLKLNNRARISQEDVLNWSEKLKIIPDEIASYFFVRKV